MPARRSPDLLQEPVEEREVVEQVRRPERSVLVRRWCCQRRAEQRALGIEAVDTALHRIGLEVGRGHLCVSTFLRLCVQPHACGPTGSRPGRAAAMPFPTRTRAVLGILGTLSRTDRTGRSARERGFATGRTEHCARPHALPRYPG